MREQQKYDDIINLERHVSKVHEQMSLEKRSAQFAPFAALTGYEDEIKETARITDNQIEIDEEIKKSLDEKIKLVQGKMVTITYFITDKKKSGGKYKKTIGHINKIDEFNKCIVLDNKEYIKIKDIIDISI